MSEHTADPVGVFPRRRGGSSCATLETMSLPKAAPAPAQDPVVAALEDAPLDAGALSPEEAEHFAALVAAGPGDTKTTSDVLAELAERAKTG